MPRRGARGLNLGSGCAPGSGTDVRLIVPGGRRGIRSGGVWRRGSPVWEEVADQPAARSILMSWRHRRECPPDGPATRLRIRRTPDAQPRR